MADKTQRVLSLLEALQKMTATKVVPNKGNTAVGIAPPHNFENYREKNGVILPQDKHIVRAHPDLLKEGQWEGGLDDQEQILSEILGYNSDNIISSGAPLATQRMIYKDGGILVDDEHMARGDKYLGGNQTNTFRAGNVQEGLPNDDYSLEAILQHNLANSDDKLPIRSRNSSVNYGVQGAQAKREVFGIADNEDFTPDKQYHTKKIDEAQGRHDTIKQSLIDLISKDPRFGKATSDMWRNGRILQGKGFRGELNEYPELRDNLAAINRARGIVEPGSSSATRRPMLKLLNQRSADAIERDSIDRYKNPREEDRSPRPSHDLTKRPSDPKLQAPNQTGQYQMDLDPKYESSSPKKPQSPIEERNFEDTKPVVPKDTDEEAFKGDRAREIPAFKESHPNLDVGNEKEIPSIADRIDQNVGNTAYYPSDMEFDELASDISDLRSSSGLINELQKNRKTLPSGAEGSRVIEHEKESRKSIVDAIRKKSSGTNYAGIKDPDQPRDFLEGFQPVPPKNPRIKEYKGPAEREVTSRLEKTKLLRAMRHQVEGRKREDELRYGSDK